MLGDVNRQGFVVVVAEDKVFGLLTNEDFRRAIINEHVEIGSISSIYAKTVWISDDFEIATELFKNQVIKFLPIVDRDGKLVNVITKSQMNALLFQGIHTNLMDRICYLSRGM